MDRPGCILVIPSWYPPDGGYFFKEHSEAIMEMGWQVDVLVNRVVGTRKLISKGPSAIHSDRISRENGLRVMRAVYLKLPGSERINIRRWASATKKLYARYQKKYGKPDLILAHSVTWAGYAASLIRKEHGIPYILVEHRSFFVWNTPEAREMVKSYHLPFFEKAFRDCSRLVPVSESMLSGLRSLIPWIDERIEVIPNMIRENMFLPPPKSREQEPFTFFWAGRLEHVKGIDLLLQAVAELKNRRLNSFEVRLAGRGSLRDRLEQQAGEMGISGMVRFLGRISRERIQEEMQRANCFVLPTRYEAFGAVLIEAMATGLPVIATRSGGPQYIVDEDNGILIDPEDVQQLAGAMGRMMELSGSYDPDRIRSLTLERFGEKRIMERYQRLFRKVISENINRGDLPV